MTKEYYYDQGIQSAEAVNKLLRNTLPWVIKADLITPVTCT